MLRIIAICFVVCGACEGGANKSVTDAGTDVPNPYVGCVLREISMECYRDPTAQLGEYRDVYRHEYEISLCDDPTLDGEICIEEGACVTGVDGITHECTWINPDKSYCTGIWKCLEQIAYGRP